MEKKVLQSVYLNDWKGFLKDKDGEIRMFRDEEEANSYIEENKLKWATIYPQPYLDYTDYFEE